MRAPPLLALEGARLVPRLALDGARLLERLALEGVRLPVLGRAEGELPRNESAAPPAMSRRPVSALPR